MIYKTYLDFLIFFLYMAVALIKAVEDYEEQNPITKWKLQTMQAVISRYFLKSKQI